MVKKTVMLKSNLSVKKCVDADYVDGGNMAKD